MALLKPILSVVIAAYNEESVMQEHIRQLITTLEERPDIPWELILINDGSTDLTGEIINAAAQGDQRVVALHLWRNYGQGRALREGFARSVGDFIITMDADLSYGPEYIWKLYDEIITKQVEIVLASPYTTQGTTENVPFLRLFFSKWGNRYLSKMSPYQISVLTCVVRIYRREVLEELFLTADGMEMQIEVLMKANLMRYKVAEIPAHLKWKKNTTTGNKKRVSKMRILSNINMSLQMGWLSRPAFLIIIFALMLILPGIVLLGHSIVKVIAEFFHNMGVGQDFFQAFAAAFQFVYRNHANLWIISAFLLVIGFQFILFALLLLQNKFYYNENFRIQQMILKSNKQTSTRVTNKDQF